MRLSLCEAPTRETPTPFTILRTILYSHFAVIGRGRVERGYQFITLNDRLFNLMITLDPFEVIM